MPTAPPPELLTALDRVCGRAPRLLLAVSGGLDSMTLLHAAAAWRPAGVRLVVATFDHGTGATARRAAALVVREARALGLPVVRGWARRPGRDEATWRRQRWRFLRRTAQRARARVVTAHTRDDQVETVFQRLLRGAGARGLAGLAAPSPVLRPWLGVPRAVLRAWAEQHGVPYVDDPSNVSRRHQRNRVRLELLPALRRVRPTIDRELLVLGRRAAGWRREVERVVEVLAPRRGGGGLYVARAALRGYSPEELAVLWPAVAARARVRLDRRGTRRLAEFTITAGRTGRVPLAGGAEVVALPHHFLVRRRAPQRWTLQPLGDSDRLGEWRLRRVEATEWARAPDDRWRAALPAEARLTVRSWLAGDRILREGAGSARRVKRFFADAGIPGPLRTGWPVVLADGEVVWIPGVCRSAAATARPGRPAVLYLCDWCPC
ncbi:MAG TPA: tRNA lysidine(34) synthetase TilS [Gemmatimonadaceae bacterium]|nr:tRNA lysidine(34) synthetase TilS [Gemmatimonadaceae bacterium]